MQKYLLKINFMFCFISVCLNNRGGPPRGAPPSRGRAMPYHNNNYQQPSQNQNQQPPVQSVQPPPPADSSATKSTLPPTTVQQTTKPTSASGLAANSTTNTAPNNNQSSGPPSTGTNTMRGRGGLMRGRGGYNPNINVTGGDMAQQTSSPPSKPYYRGVSRGRGGGYQQGPSRPGPILAPNHQPHGGMVQQG